MESIIEKIKNVSLISKEIKEIEKQDASTNDFNFRKECYLNIKKLLRKQDALMNEIKDMSLFLIKNRLSGCLLMGVLPHDNYFNLLDDIKHYNYHSNILNIVNDIQEETDLLCENGGVLDYEQKIEILNIKTNLALIDEIIKFHFEIKIFDDKIHEFLYEEVGYNLCTITNQANRNKKLNKTNMVSRYEKIKSICFELFSKLDKTFIKINKRDPKNTEVENMLWE